VREGVWFCEASAFHRILIFLISPNSLNSLNSLDSLESLESLDFLNSLDFLKSRV
jgi:hypothetical protein